MFVDCSCTFIVRLDLPASNTLEYIFVELTQELDYSTYCHSARQYFYKLPCLPGFCRNNLLRHLGPSTCTFKASYKISKREPSTPTKKRFYTNNRMSDFVLRLESQDWSEINDVVKNSSIPG